MCERIPGLRFYFILKEQYSLTTYNRQIPFGTKSDRKSKVSLPLIITADWLPSSQNAHAPERSVNILSLSLSAANKSSTQWC